MFLQGVSEGIALFWSWPVIVGCLILSATLWGTIFAVSAMAPKENGCLASVGSFVIRPVVIAIVETAVLVWLLPTLLPYAGGAAWNFWTIVVAGIVAVIVIVILGVIPVVGSFVYETPGMQLFVQGLVILRFLSPADANFAGFWSIVGYGIVVAVLSWLFNAVLALTLRDGGEGGWQHFVAALVGPLWGIVALCMYCAESTLMR